jgi:hypothetical protein
VSAELHKAIVDAARNVRDVFDSHDVGHMTLEIEVSGRVHDELKIKYSIGEYSGTCEGGDLIAVLDEYMRRRGWNARNAPLALPPPAPMAANTDGEDAEIR